MRLSIVCCFLAVVVVGCTNQSQSELALNPPAPSSDPPRNDATDEAAGAEAEAAAEEFAVGDAAPSFENITGVDDQPHSLKEFADAKAVIVTFTCNSCPVAKAYEDRLTALQNDYKDKGVQVVAINVNNLEPDKLPAMKERAEEKGFNFPYLYDPTQQVARDYGATVTPHIFLLDGERRLAYVGAIDDNMEEAKVTQQYLRDAIDAVLEGKSPETTETKAVGCGIKYE